MAAAAAIAVVVGVAGALVWEERQQAGILAERARETESLAQTVRSLKVRLDALDAAQSRDDLTDLRRSVGDMKSTAVSTREFNTALAVLSQRVDKLGNEEGAKVDRLSERVDHEGSTLTAELSTRIDKLEKKIVAPPPQAGQMGQPPVQPKFSAGVSMETTGSIERPRPLVRGYIVLDARSDVALIGGTFWRAGSPPGRFSPGGWACRAYRAQRRAVDGADQRRPHRLGGLSAVLTSRLAFPAPTSAEDRPVPVANPGDRARRFR